MAERIKLEVGGLQALRQMNPMLMSYNVEFAEVTSLHTGTDCRYRGVLCRTYHRGNCSDVPGFDAGICADQSV